MTVKKKNKGESKAGLYEANKDNTNMIGVGSVSLIQPPQYSCSIVINRTFRIVSDVVLAWNGGSPQRSIYMITPTDQTSHVRV